jgi:hypothetical protein
MDRTPPGAIHPMSRWTVRIIGIVMLLILFLVMFQMLNTLKRMADRQEQGVRR